MAGIPDDKVQEIRDRVDIVDLVGRYVELRRSGRNYVGLCPFHQERSPSFNVNPALKGYKCFGCGAGGDAIRFVMEIEGKGFPETLRKLAELYGVSLPSTMGWGGGSGTDVNERDEAYLLMRTATELYRSILLEAPEGAAGRDYLEARGVTPEAAAAFALGYAPAPTEAGWDRLARALQAKGLSIPLAQKLGLLKASERRDSAYDAFRGRLMFPVIQPGGEVIAFSGRIVPPHDQVADGGPPPGKYVNSSDSFLFHKGKTLYGLAVARPAIRDAKRILLVEGNLDVVKLHQHGHREVVAPLGTSFTDDQARLIARFTSQVVMCFDGDKAGREAALKALPLLIEQDLDVRMVSLPEGEDPDSLGPERFANLLADAQAAIGVVMERNASWAGESPDARARAFERALPLISKVPRESARSFYAERAAMLFRVPLDRVLREVRVRRGEAPGRPVAPVQVSSAAKGPGPRPLPPLPAAQAELTMLLVDVPHLATLAERSGALEHVDDVRLRPVLETVIAGAKEGRTHTLPELLERVGPEAQPQVLEQVFAGKFRMGDDGAGTSTPQAGLVSPQAVLQDLLHRCQMEAIDVEVHRREREFQSARATGDLDGQRESQLAIMALRREKDALRHAPPPLLDA